MTQSAVTRGRIDMVATLLVNSFHVDKIDRYPGGVILNVYKFDKLGAKVNYSILYTNDSHETPLVESLMVRARAFGATPVVVCDSKITDACKSYTQKEFFDLFAGFVNTGLTLLPNLPELLNKLGLNKLPDGLAGDPDDLLEIYTKECLQFILQSPTKRFGQDRSFEKLPDGIVLGRERFMVLFDAKAYKNGFEFQSDDINRFSFYVNDFNNRYSAYLGRVFTFLVVSGKFTDSKESISNRSEQLYRECGCKLACLTARDLGKIVNLVRENAMAAGAIIWKNIFSSVLVSPNAVKKEINRIRRDNLV